jgi:integrase
MKGSRRLVRGRGKSAVWELRVYAGKSPITGKPKYVSRHFHGSAKLADDALSELVIEVGTVDHTGPPESFGTYLDRWLPKATILKELSPTTVREHKRTVEKIIKPALGEVELRRLDAGMLNDMYVSLRTRERPLSASSVRRVHAVISAALAQAVKEDKLASSPADKATPPSVRQAPKVAPSPEDVQAMIATADKADPDMATFIALAAVTGARRGELCGLRWGDVDFDRATLTIERSVAVVSGLWVTKGTKTHAGRVLALDPFGEEVLRRQRARHEDRAADLGVELTDDTPVLSYNLERPISPDTVSHYVRRIASKAGVDTHLHGLRHFAATQMIGGGHDVRTVAGRLGHRDASTTLKVYSHFLPERDRDAADFLGKALTADE